MKKRGNKTYAVIKLFNRHSQEIQTFKAWHIEVYKAVRSGCVVGHTKEPLLHGAGSLGISQEQTRKKATKLQDGDSETVIADSVEGNRI